MSLFSFCASGQTVVCPTVIQYLGQLVRNERREVTADTTEIRRILTDDCKQVYTDTMHNWKKSSDSQTDTACTNTPITRNEIITVLKEKKKNKNLATKVQGLMASEANSIKHLEKS